MSHSPTAGFISLQKDVWYLQLPKGLWSSALGLIIQRTFGVFLCRLPTGTKRLPSSVLAGRLHCTPLRPQRTCVPMRGRFPIHGVRRQQSDCFPTWRQRYRQRPCDRESTGTDRIFSLVEVSFILSLPQRTVKCGLRRSAISIRLKPTAVNQTQAPSAGSG